MNTFTIYLDPAKSSTWSRSDYCECGACGKEIYMYKNCYIIVEYDIGGFVSSAYGCSMRCVNFYILSKI